MFWTCSFLCIKWQPQLPPYKGAYYFKSIHEALSWAGLSIPLTPWNRLSHRTAKPTKWPVRQVKSQINLGIHPVWSEKSWVRGYPGHWVHSEDSDQIGRMPRLICVFAMRTYHFVCFVLLRLNCFVSLLPKIKLVISYVPCSPKLSLCPCSLHSQTSCSPEINAFVPVFPKNPAWAHHTSMTSWVKLIQISARNCAGSQCDIIT